jgi:hypothetical protein
MSFRQDAHRRMASVIARIRSADSPPKSAREARALKITSLSLTVNGEKLFMLLSSADCTEVEYATERYSESPPPVGTKTDKGDTAPRKRCRGFAPRMQVELESSSNEAPTSSRSIFLREIHRQIDHNEMLQRRLAHSTKLFRDAERIAMGEGNPPAPQAVRPSPWLCPLPLFHRSIGGNSAPACALAPLSGVCCRPRIGPRLRGIRYIFAEFF